MILLLLLIFSAFSRTNRYLKGARVRNRNYIKRHRQRHRSTNNDLPYVVPGIALTSAQTKALDQTKDLFMQFRFKQVFAKQMPKLLEKMFGKGNAGQARLKEFLMPQLMPIAVKGPNGKDQIALMPGMARGRVPHKGGKKIPGSQFDVLGAQFVPGGISPFHMDQGYGRTQHQQHIPPEMLEEMLSEISDL